MRMVLATAVLAIALAACGDDDDDGGTGPETVSLDGDWTLSVPSLAGAGLSCSITGVTMALEMSSSIAFEGSHTGGTLVCDGIEPGEFTGGPIVNGSLDYLVFEFDFVDDAFHFTGTLNSSGTTLSGTNFMDLGGGTTLNGTWSATRQSAVRAGAPAGVGVPAGFAGPSVRELLGRQ